MPKHNIECKKINKKSTWTSVKQLISPLIVTYTQNKLAHVCVGEAGVPASSLLLMEVVELSFPPALASLLFLPYPAAHKQEGSLSGHAQGFFLMRIRS